MPRPGLKLGDITDLLAVRDTGVCPCEPAADLLHRRLTELDAEPTEQIRVHCGMTEPDDWRMAGPTLSGRRCCRLCGRCVRVDS